MWHNRGHKDLTADSYFDPTSSDWQIINTEAQKENTVLIPLDHLLDTAQDRLDLLDPRLAVEKVREIANAVVDEICPPALELMEPPQQPKRSRPSSIADDTSCVTATDGDAFSPTTTQFEGNARLRVRLYDPSASVSTEAISQEKKEAAAYLTPVTEAPRRIVFFGETREDGGESSDEPDPSLLPRALPVDTNVGNEEYTMVTSNESKNNAAMEATSRTTATRDPDRPLTTDDLSQMTAEQFLRHVRAEAKRLPKVLKMKSSPEPVPTTAAATETTTTDGPVQSRTTLTDVKDMKTKTFALPLSRRRALAEEAAAVSSLVRRYQAKLPLLPKSDPYAMPSIAARSAARRQLKDLTGEALHTALANPDTLRKLWGYLGWVRGVREAWTQYETESLSVSVRSPPPKWVLPELPTDDPNPYVHNILPSVTYVEWQSEDPDEHRSLSLQDILARIRAVPLPPQPVSRVKGMLAPHLSSNYVAGLGWGLRYNLEPDDDDYDNDEETLVPLHAAGPKLRITTRRGEMDGTEGDDEDEMDIRDPTHHDLEDESVDVNVQMYIDAFIQNTEAWLEWAVPKFPFHEDQFTEICRERNECLQYCLGVVPSARAVKASQSPTQTEMGKKGRDIDADADTDANAAADTEAEAEADVDVDVDADADMEMPQESKSDLSADHTASDHPMADFGVLKGTCESRVREENTVSDRSSSHLCDSRDQSLLERIVGALTPNPHYGTTRDGVPRVHSVPPYLCQVARLDSTAKRALLLHLLLHVDNSYQHVEGEESVDKSLPTLSPLHVEWLFVLLTLVDKPVDADIAAEMLRVSRRLVALRAAAASRLELWEKGELKEMSTGSMTLTWIDASQGTDSQGALKMRIPARRPMSRYAVVITVLRREINELRERLAATESPMVETVAKEPAQTQVTDVATSTGSTNEMTCSMSDSEALLAKKQALLQLLHGGTTNSEAEVAEYEAYKRDLESRIPRRALDSMMSSSDQEPNANKPKTSHDTPVPAVSPLDLEPEILLALREAELAALLQWGEEAISESSVVATCTELLAVIEGRFGQVDKSYRVLDAAHAVQRAINGLSLREQKP